MRKKYKLVIMALGILIFFIPSYSFSLTIYETTGWIVETEGVTYDFEADLSPYLYQATLTDLSEAPFFGFDFLYLSLTTSTDTVDSIVGPGSFTFDAAPGVTYFANIFGTGGGSVGAGLFGLKITNSPIHPVPEPTTALLIASSLLGIACLKRKFKK